MTIEQKLLREKILINRITADSISLVSGVSRPTILKLLKGEDITIKSQRKLEQAFRYIEENLTHEATSIK